ncbi:MAG: tripartite tricarboxylate transporter TctB family protein [Deltaproteobacteria bacterium]|jgi:hypothetical protein|nr:tripartite tricarboxylate transporter TctB family protein [Deltaproteobacteria bacterium]
MLQRITKHGEVIFLLVLLLGSAYLISIAMDIPVGRSKAIITPATWPILSLGMVAIFSALLLVLRIVRRDKQDAAKAIQAEATSKDAISEESAEVVTDAEGMPTEEATHPQRAFYTLGFLVVYMAALPYLGFVAVTLITMSVYMLSLGAKRIYAVLIPLCMTGLVVGIFGIALKVPLPRGISLFRELSQLFY